MDPNVITFTVAIPNAVSQRGRFLAVGEPVEMEEHVARAEFPGRLKYPDGRLVQKPEEAEVEALNAFVRSMASRPAHERVSLLEERIKTVPDGSVAAKGLTDLLEQAKADAEADQARHTQELSQTPAPDLATGKITAPVVLTGPSGKKTTVSPPAAQPSSDESPRT